jgi:hypothetical protein
MPGKELTTVASEPRDDRAIQVVVTLPLRQQRRETRGHPALAAPLGSRAQVPRITRLMALAIKFQAMVERGEVRDYADLARLGYVTRARITQIMNLLNLAPCIQEAILLHQGTAHAIEERRLRCITSEVFWQDQRQLWERISPIG